MIRLVSITLIFLSAVPATTSSQTIREEDIRNTVSPGLRNVVLETYQGRMFRPAWADKGLRDELQKSILQAEELGLEPEDYHTIPYAEGTESAISDISHTEAAIHLLKDLSEGNRYPVTGYKGLNLRHSDPDLPGLLSAFIDSKDFTGLASRVQPSCKEYRNAIVMLAYFTKISREKEFSDIRVSSSRTVISNNPLVKRLRQLGFITRGDDELNDSILRSAVISAQKKFSVLADGKIRSTFLAAINIPVKSRIDQLSTALNIIRWSDRLKKKGPVILLNIPSAGLIVYENNEVMLVSKVITGKKSTPTPTLTSEIDEVILYPYWVVPYNIATKEILPRIKKDISYLDRFHFQVIDGRGRQLDPHNIRWKSLSPSYFPYTLRQSTGCDNSLGLIKFDFTNPYSVYLHDTPGKELFTMNRRFFSHGCMRVEKPVELARILLGENRQAIDTLTEKGCLFNQKPVLVKTEKKAALAVLYSTAWYDESGEIFFFEDIYGKNPQD